MKHGAKSARSVVSSLAIVTFLLAFAHASPAAVESNFIPIDYPDAVSTLPDAINDAGDIVGNYIDQNRIYHAFLFSRGRFTSFDVPLSGVTYIEAQGINNKGDVVGVYILADNTKHGFVLSKGTFRYVDAPGSSDTRLWAITESGEIVGMYGDAGGRIHGFLLSQGRFVVIDHPSSIRTNALDLLPKDRKDGWCLVLIRCQVVGRYDTADGIAHGYLLDKGVFKTIDVPGAVLTALFAVNKNGEISGRYVSADRKTHGFVLSKDGLMSVDFPGAVSTEIHKLNNAGEMVGFYTDSSGKTHGFRFSRGK